MKEVRKNINRVALGLIALTILFPPYNFYAVEENGHDIKTVTKWRFNEDVIGFFKDAIQSIGEILSSDGEMIFGRKEDGRKPRFDILGLETCGILLLAGVASWVAKKGRWEGSKQMKQGNIL